MKKDKVFRASLLVALFGVLFLFSGSASASYTCGEYIDVSGGKFTIRYGSDTDSNNPFNQAATCTNRIFGSGQEIDVLVYIQPSDVNQDYSSVIFKLNTLGAKKFLETFDVQSAIYVRDDFRQSNQGDLYYIDYMSNHLDYDRNLVDDVKNSLQSGFSKNLLGVDQYGEPFAFNAYIHLVVKVKDNVPAGDYVIPLQVCTADGTCDDTLNVPAGTDPALKIRVVQTNVLTAREDRVYGSIVPSEGQPFLKFRVAYPGQSIDMSYKIINPYFDSDEGDTLGPYALDGFNTTKSVRMRKLNQGIPGATGTMTIELLDPEDIEKTIARKELQFSIDSGSPISTYDQDDNLEDIKNAHGGVITRRITSLGATLQDSVSGQPEAGRVSITLTKTDGEGNEEIYDYEVITDEEGKYFFEGLESGDGEYGLTLSAWDKAGNPSGPQTFDYVIDVSSAPYYLSSYNVSPWSPTTPPGANEEKTISFDLAVAKGSATADVQGVDLYIKNCAGNVCNALETCLGNQEKGEICQIPENYVKKSFPDTQATLDWELNSTDYAEICGNVDTCLLSLFFKVNKIGDPEHPYIIYQDDTEARYSYKFSSSPQEITLSEFRIKDDQNALEPCRSEDPTRCDLPKPNSKIELNKSLIPIFSGKYELDLSDYPNRKVEIMIYDDAHKAANNGATHAKITGIPLNTVQNNRGGVDMEFKHRYFLSGASLPFDTDTTYYAKARLVDTIQGYLGGWSNWYLFSLSRGESEGSTLPVTQQVSTHKVADDTETYAVSLVLVDRFGNYVRNLEATLYDKILETNRNIYFDSLLNPPGGTSALTLGGTLNLGSEHIYTGGLLKSAAPSVFADQDYRLAEGKSVLNRARGLALGRDLDMGVRLEDGAGVLPAQSVSYTNFRDTDGDGYSDGLELTYGTDLNLSDSKPAYLDQDFSEDNVPCCDKEGGSSCKKVMEVTSLDELGGTNCPLARKSGEPETLYYFPSLAADGEYAPAVNFLPPLQVTLQKLYKNEAGNWVPERQTEDMVKEQWSNEERLMLPKIEMLAEEEGRLRLELKNIGSTPIALDNVNFKLRNYFNFAAEQASFNDLQFVKAYRGTDPVNMSTVTSFPTAAINVSGSAKSGLDFSGDSGIEPLEAGEILWLDFSVRPGVYGNLITSRAYYNCEMELPFTLDDGTSNTAAFPCSPEIIDLFRSESYIGVTQPLISATERDLQLKKVKEEMISNIMSATRPLPGIVAANSALCLGEKSEDESHYELFDEQGLIVKDCASTERINPTNYEANGVGSYRNGSVYAFRARNVRLGDGILPVYLPNQALTIVTVGSNLIIASDLKPAETSDAKALGLVSIWDTASENQNQPSDPLTETSWNEAYKGGNILINSKVVKEIYAHLFAEAAVFNIDLEDEATQTKHLSSLYDILSGKLNNSYHYETKRQNTENQLHIMGLFYAGYNTYRGTTEDKPYTEKTSDYLKYNTRLDLSFMRVYRSGEDGVGEPAESLLGGAEGEEHSDPRALVIEPTTAYGLPEVFQTKENILLGEGTLQ